MLSPWQDVCCAVIPVEDLRVLADLRGCPRIAVSVVRDRAWIKWEGESESTKQRLVERLLPVPRVEFFARRNDCWYRLGRRLPAFDFPPETATDALPLDRILLPRPMTPLS